MKKFAANWQFDHQASLPHYPQSKRKDRKCREVSQEITHQGKASGEDRYLAILDLRNTSSAGIGALPTQRLFGRRTKTLLPTAGILLQPKIVEGSEEKLRERKVHQERYYNRGARELPELRPGDTMRMKPLLTTDRGKLWKKAIVFKQVAPRLYEVDLQGSAYRKNT